MMNRKVSIVVPVYNSHKTLPKCLDSLISQTYSNIEIICVNDCSKDNSLEIIKEYQEKDSRVKLINHEQNKNAGGARNSGIKAASGAYICFVDNDDWLTSDAVEILINASDNCRIDFIAPDWCEYHNEICKFEKKNFFIDASKDENCNHSLKYGSRILGCLIKKDVFVKNNLFFPEKTFFEDNAIGDCLLFCSNEIKAIDRVLYYYSVADGSSSRSVTLEKIIDRIKTTNLFLDNLKTRGFITEKNKKLIECRYLLYTSVTIILLAYDGTHKAKALLNQIVEDYKEMVPNSYVDDINPLYVKLLAHPFLFFYIYKYRNMIKKIIPQKLITFIRK